MGHRELEGVKIPDPAGQDGGAGGTAPMQANQQLALANLKIRSQYIPIAYFVAG